MGYRLTKIYTKTGDDGYTNLGTRERIAKNHPRIAVLGTLDELNCHIGLILITPKLEQGIIHCLTQLQQELFDFGGELCPPFSPKITDEKVKQLEQWLDKWNSQLPALNEFILPRGLEVVVYCHLARAVCRRAERELVTLALQEEIRQELLHYINRLSDLLFVMARWLGRSETEILWNNPS